MDDIEALEKIRHFEENTPQDQWALGWSWSDVGLYPANITGLLVRGLAEKSYTSNRHRLFKMTEKGRELLAAGLSLEVEEEAPPIVFADDIFSDIEGYNDIKELFTRVVTLEKPVHVLLAGPPAIAKSLFLSELERAGGPSAMWVVGSAASQPGLWDSIAARKPRWLLVDELEKMPLVDMAAFLSLMETGRLVRTKVRRTMDIQLTIWVFAACNRLNILPPELRSRFAVKHLRQYNKDEFEKVVGRVLTRREGVSEEDAHKIGEVLVGRTQDIRDAIRVGRLSKAVGVERAVQLLLG